jgi:N-acetylneuraminic acid mutarotase
VLSRPSYFPGVVVTEEAFMSRSICRALILGSLILPACENTSPTPQDSGAPDGPSFALARNGWVSRASIPDGRWGHAAGVVNNSRGEPVLYVFGGNDTQEGDVPVQTIQAYNYVTNRWTTKKACCGPYLMNTAAVVGGKVYLIGGYEDTGDGVAALREMYVYDPVADVRTRKADIPQESALGVTGVIGGRIFLLIGTGGDFGERFSRRFYRYNPATNTWARMPSCPHVHLDAAAGVINGKFYVAGGWDASDRLTREVDAYDPATNRWTMVAPLPEARVAAAGVALLGKLYVIGGAGASGGRKVHSYDPVTNTWRSRASMLTRRFWLAAAPLITPFGNPKILATGGLDPDNSEAAGSANELYTP